MKSEMIEQYLRESKSTEEGLPKVEQALREILNREAEPIDIETESMEIGSFIRHLKEAHGMPSEVANEGRVALTEMMTREAQARKDNRVLLKCLLALSRTQARQQAVLRDLLLKERHRG